MLTLLLLLSFFGVIALVGVVAPSVFLVVRNNQKTVIQQAWTCRWMHGHGRSKWQKRNSAKLLNTRTRKSWKKSWRQRTAKCKVFRHTNQSVTVVSAQSQTEKSTASIAVDGRNVFPPVWDPQGSIVAGTIALPTTLRGLSKMVRNVSADVLALTIEGGGKALEGYENSLREAEEVTFSPRKARKVEVIMASKKRERVAVRSLSLGQLRKIDQRNWEQRTRKFFVRLSCEDRLHEAAAVLSKNRTLLEEERIPLSMSLFGRGALRLKRGETELAICDLKCAVSLNGTLMEATL